MSISLLKKPFFYLNVEYWDTASTLWHPMMISCFQHKHYKCHSVPFHNNSSVKKSVFDKIDDVSQIDNSFIVKTV